MKRARIFLSAATAVIALSGCASKVIKVEEAFPCPLEPARLAERCANPQPVADDATFGDVIAMAQQDRANLRTCAAHDEMLAKAIAACNAAIIEHNKAIRAINQQISADK